VRQQWHQLSDADAHGALMVGSDIITIGTLIGALIGIITFLLRTLVGAKSAHIATLEKELADVMAERNLFRDLNMHSRRED
jgi:hypothetical protein